jgi:hypothetical protein
MQVMLEARSLWSAIGTGTAERELDRQAMEALLCAVPPDMISTLGVKATAKEGDSRRQRPCPKGEGAVPSQAM